MKWEIEQTDWKAPMAVLKDGERPIVKIYLSPDQASLRIALAELVLPEQVSVRFLPAANVIDFKRKP